MNTYQDETYGERIASVYDELYSAYDPAMITCLHELAGGGPALELGIGTGRIALPLHASGVPVYGIDASQGMVAKLHAKAGGENIQVKIGSFAQAQYTEKFALVYIVFNTFFALLTQEEQLACFASAAEQLSPTGVFVIEAFVPDMTRFTGGQTIRAVEVETDLVRIDVTVHDPLTQQVTSSHVHIDPNGVHMYPVKLRYAWPTELDLMARLAGLSLKQRWGDWDQSVFSPTSTRHISVYARA